jgi:5-formyltetrahydrofolate cyclo-ligase
MEKQLIRQMMYQKRKALSSKERKLASKSATKLLMTSKIFLKSIHIACYVAKDAEMDLYAMIEKIWDLNKHCYLPVLYPKQSGQMLFIEHLPQDELITNRFGIKEPQFQKEKVIETKNLDLVIVPTVAFDIKGHRIGRGGGYYDNAFQFLTRTLVLKKPFLCGLAYKFQQIPEIISRKEDIRLHAVVTESEIIMLGSDPNML